MNDLKGIIEDCNKSDLVSKEVIKKVIEIIGQEEWNDLYDGHSNICTTMGELIITLKGITNLEKENAELRKVAEFQQSSNMETHFENKRLKEVLAVGSTWNKGLNSRNKYLEEKNDKYRNMVFDKMEQLTKAKELVRSLYYIIKDRIDYENNIGIKDEMWRAEQFLKENSTYERIQKAKYNYTN